MENVKQEKDAKIIFNPVIARHLLKSGCTMCDIKPAKDNPVKTVFVFEYNDKFKVEFDRINKEIAASREAQKDDSL